MCVIPVKSTLFVEFGHTMVLNIAKVEVMCQQFFGLQLFNLCACA